ncbi:MAG: hypothetical protein C0403_07145 [Desulfobacterium sp.]|nr:hypothetical protein [Desulfobacterium sp.]
MITFSGTYFDGKTSIAHLVEVRLKGTEIRVKGYSPKDPLIFPEEQWQIEPALGSQRRTIRTEDGGRIDTQDYLAVEQLEVITGQNKGLRLVHFLEIRWIWAMFCIAGLIFLTWFGAQFGIPYMAMKAADAVPNSALNQLSEKTLNLLDDRFLFPSKLEEIKKKKVQSIFNHVIAELDPSGDYYLVFRSSPKIGANAFALPSGTIIITDELIRLAKNDGAISGVIAHEACHVFQKHGLRTVFQNIGIFMLISTLAGDVVSITSVAATLPTILIESGYARQFEQEADLVAGKYLIKTGIGTLPFQEILSQLVKDHRELPHFSFFSNHPETMQRINKLKEIGTSDNLHSQVK